MRPEGRGITGVWQADNVSDQVLHTPRVRWRGWKSSDATFLTKLPGQWWRFS